MQTFNSDGVRIAFMDEGEGDPILLIHGFASSVKDNWIDPSWVGFLTQNGFRVVAIDNRGHGESEKLYDPTAYAAPLMAEDARRLLDHLGIARADVMGYSMGARITAFLALQHPDRVRSAIFAGLGGNMVRPMAGTGPIAHALEAESIDDVTNPTARTFRAFAEKTGSDLKALAACIRGARDPITREAVATLTLSRAGGHRQRGRDRRQGRGAGRIDTGRRGAYGTAAGSHAHRRRSRLQGRRAGVSAAAALSQAMEYGRNH